MDILLLCHRIPYPPDKGDKIRSFSLLRHLAERHRVRLVAAADEAADIRHVPALEALAERVRVLPFGRVGACLRTAASLVKGGSLSVAWFPGSRLAAASREMVADRRPDLVLAISTQTAPAAFSLGVPVVLDLVDRDSAKWAQYGARLRGVKGRIYALEARRLAEAEEHWIQRSVVSFVISEHERSLFPEGLRSRIRVVGNPVKIERFSTDRGQEDARVVLFVGALDYFPNVDAVSFYAREVLPRVRAVVPGVELHVVGPRAAAALEALDGQNGVRLLGYVPDLEAVYARAALSVAPFRLTQGVLNKVLEALASSIPVVATPEAVRGLGLADGDGVRLARTAEALAARTVELLTDAPARRALGREARRIVETRFAWPGDLTRLDAHLTEAMRAEATVG
jgi:sugar transferase (PEP-CTERM/EpsH1 system associated)